MIGEISIVLRKAIRQSSGEELYYLEFIPEGGAELGIQSESIPFSPKAARDLVDQFSRIGIQSTSAILFDEYKIEKDMLVEALQSEIQYLRQIVDKLMGKDHE